MVGFLNQIVNVLGTVHKRNLSTYLISKLASFPEIASSRSASSKTENRKALYSSRIATLTQRRFYSIINTNDDRTKLLDNFDNFIFDCDGVIYVGKNPIDGAIATIESLINLGKNVLYVTNNSSRSRRDLGLKLTGLGFPSNGLKVVSAASSAAFHCKKILAEEKKKVFFIGEEGLQEELHHFGLETVWASDLKLPTSLDGWESFEKDSKVGVVVVGCDWNFNYAKATAAASYLIADHVHFIGTDRDAYFPTPNTHIRQVGTGSVVKMVETGSGREAFYIGKPDRAMWEHIEDEYQEKMVPSRTLMVGDTLYSDVEFGNSRGIATLLVETGNHTRQDAEKNVSKPLQIPTYIAKSLGDALFIQ